MKYKYFFAFLFLLAFSFGIFSSLRLFASTTYTDDSNDALGFGGGNFSDMQWNSSPPSIGLSATGTSNGIGSFTSRVFDTVYFSGWELFSWIPNRPYGKELPNNAGVESVYTDGNVDMTDIHLLLHFNETFGDPVDNSGLEHSATASNTSPTNPAILSYALAFDGSSSHVDLGDHADFDFGEGESFSVAAWFKTSGSDGYIAQKIGTASWAILVANNKLLFEISDATTTSQIESTADVNDDTWHHFVAVRDASSGNLYLYVDGEEATTEVVDGTVSLANDASLLIGKYSGQYAFPFLGTIDEFALWGKSFSAAQVTDLYLRGALNVQFQVRSCDDEECDIEAFVGPDGNTLSYFSELSTTTLGFPSFSLMESIASNPYFQYRVEFSTRNDVSPQVASVSVVGLLYTLGIVESGGNTLVLEGSSGDTYTLALTGRPDGDVDVDISSDAECDASESSITFTNANWDTPVTVTTTASNDSVSEPQRSCVITHTLSSMGDFRFDGIVSNLTATVRDPTSYISIVVDDGSVAYGQMSPSQTKNTVTLAQTQTVSTTSDLPLDILIKGQDTGCPWTLAATSSPEHYVHEVCATTEVGTCIVSSYVPLTTVYQTLYSDVATSSQKLFDLQLTLPTQTNCLDQQQVDVFLLATEAE